MSGTTAARSCERDGALIRTRTAEQARVVVRYPIIRLPPNGSVSGRVSSAFLSARGAPHLSWRRGPTPAAVAHRCAVRNGSGLSLAQPRAFAPQRAQNARRGPHVRARLQPQALLIPGMSSIHRQPSTTYEPRAPCPVRRAPSAERRQIWYLNAMRATIDKAGRVVIPAAIRDRMGLGAGAQIEITVDETGIRLERVADGPKLVRIGRRLVARPSVPPDARPALDIAALVEEERNRWP